MKCSKCRTKFEGEKCPACGQVIAPRRAAPGKLPVPKQEMLAPEPSPWGCTDLLSPAPSKIKPKEEIPDPLPEYITPTQARKWGIQIRPLGEPKK